jgi:hypothetical protein
MNLQKLCLKCDSPMRRRELRGGFKFVCTNKECRFIDDDALVFTIPQAENVKEVTT